MRAKLSYPFVTVILLIFIAPIIGIVSRALTGTQDGAMAHLLQTVLPHYLSSTTLLLIGAGAVGLLFGVSCAIIVARYDFPLRRVFELLLIFPLCLPPYITAFTYAGLFEYAGPVQTGLRDWFGVQGNVINIRSLPVACMIFGFALMPYIYLPVRFILLRTRHLEDAARTLGVGGIKRFMHITLPVIRPAAFIGLALLMMETMSDFGTVQYLAVDSLSTGIYRSWFYMNDMPLAARLSVMMLACAGVILMLERHMRRKQDIFTASSPMLQSANIVREGGKCGMLMTIWCAVPVTLGFALPFLALLHDALTLLADGASLPILYIKNSFYIALISSVIGVGISLALALTLRFMHDDVRRASLLKPASRIVTLGYAVPSAVTAVGVMMFLGFVDDALFPIFPSIPLLTTTIAALIFAYIFRFTGMSFNTLDNAAYNIPAGASMLGKLHGKKGIYMLGRVYLPMMREFIGVATIMFFVECVKELSATLIIRPFNFETLATRAYELAADERLDESSLPAIFIVLLSAVPIVLISRSNKGMV